MLKVKLLNAMNSNIPNKLFSILFVFLIITSDAQNQWTKERANEWQKKHGWLVGCNYINASSINQLEMWQAETFNPKEIDKELALAESIGFNFVRVFLHDVAWKQDSTGFKKRIFEFLSICEKHKIKVMFVFFDDCWYGNPQPGKQPNPAPGLHNSGWLQSPSFAVKKDPSQWNTLQYYVKDIVKTFANDQRVIIWDLYNEPGNNDFHSDNLPLCKSILKWVKEVNPSQPITFGIWQLGNPLYRDITNFQLLNSDVISFHNYAKYENMNKDIANYKSFGRPVICTEYLARTFNSNFDPILGLLKQENVGAVNWGLVSGKSQTMFPWDAPLNGTEPTIWHHDLFRKDGAPFNAKEIEYIKKLTGK
ncbi:MAG: cellulase family glycosylhydrolase [Bacteroidota bacterium]|nr:cellulase family glycosylhydrolase [Bacteroidota bacterium]